MAEERQLRVVRFESLIKSGRAVKVYSRKTWGRSSEFVYVSAQLAGEQNPNGSDRVFTIGFKDRQSAKKAAGSLMAVMRDGFAQKWITSDTEYNRLVTLWAEAAKHKVEHLNAELLKNAEEKAKAAPKEDVLVDVRGMSLKDYLIAGLQRLGIGKKEN